MNIEEYIAHETKKFIKKTNTKPNTLFLSEAHHRILCKKYSGFMAKMSTPKKYVPLVGVELKIVPGAKVNVPMVEKVVC